MPVIGWHFEDEQNDNIIDFDVSMKDPYYGIPVTFGGHAGETYSFSGEPEIRIGGSGDDVYNVPPGAAVLIRDVGGNDKIIAPGVTYDNGGGTRLDGHVEIWDDASGTSVAVLDWKSSGAIETWETADGIYDNEYLKSMESIFIDRSWDDAGQNIARVVGPTSGSELQNFVNWLLNFQSEDGAGGNPDTGDGQEPSLIEKIVNGVYRFFNKETGFHFYSSDFAEASSVASSLPAFDFESVAYKSIPETDPAAAPVYRFYNTETQAHFYTANAEERDVVRETMPAFNYEGVAYHIHDTADGDDIALYRFYNTATHTHFYTADEVEKDAVIETLEHFTFEGAVGYVDVA